MRDANGRKIYPEIGFGQNLTNFAGMTAAVSDTVSAKNEITPDTKLLGIVGQFDAFRWGVQRSIGAHLIEYGDPDGLGDLQRQPDCNPCRNCIRNWNHGSGSIYKDREGGRVI